MVVGGSWAGIRAGERGVFGVGSSHSTRFKFKDLCLFVFGGGVREMGARRGKVMGGGYSIVRNWANTGKNHLPYWKETKAARSPSSVRMPQSTVPPLYLLRHAGRVCIREGILHLDPSDFTKEPVRSSVRAIFLARH